MQDRDTSTTRRKFVAGGATALLAGVAGCADALAGDGSDSGTPGTDIQLRCTEAYITDFQWDSVLFGDDSFEAVLVNQGDVAGTVVVELRFWDSESKQSLQGTVSRSFSIGAQATEEIQIQASKPTDRTDWADMDVVEQDCE